MIPSQGLIHQFPLYLWLWKLVLVLYRASLPVYGFNQNPKIYVDVNCIQLVDPLLHGFNVHIPEQFSAEYLNPFSSPLIYATAVALNNENESVRKKLYFEQIKSNIVELHDLKSKTWYYLCIEFENMHRDDRRGNTSTTCRLARTLDQFGKSATSAIANLHLTAVSERSMEFQLEVDADYRLMIDAHLEQGPTALQTFYVSQPKSIRIRFGGLRSGFNYGRLCIRETPVLRSYTAMGRSVQVGLDDCHFSDLRTVVNSYGGGVVAELRSSWGVGRNGGMAGCLNCFNQNSSIICGVLLLLTMIIRYFLMDR